MNQRRRGYQYLAQVRASSSILQLEQLVVFPVAAGGAHTAPNVVGTTARACAEDEHFPEIGHGREYGATHARGEDAPRQEREAVRGKVSLSRVPRGRRMYLQQNGEKDGQGKERALLGHHGFRLELRLAGGESGRGLSAATWDEGDHEGAPVSDKMRNGAGPETRWPPRRTGSTSWPRAWSSPANRCASRREPARGGRHGGRGVARAGTLTGWLAERARGASGVQSPTLTHMMGR